MLPHLCLSVFSDQLMYKYFSTVLSCRICCYYFTFITFQLFQYTAGKFKLIGSTKSSEFLSLADKKIPIKYLFTLRRHHGYMCMLFLALWITREEHSLCPKFVSWWWSDKRQLSQTFFPIVSRMLAARTYCYFFKDSMRFSNYQVQLVNSCL